MIDLRDYQEALLDRVRDALRRGVNAPLVVAPTGSGKTRIFSAIAAGARARKKRVYILVHRRKLLRQTLRALHALGITAGQIASGKPMTRDLIQVASVPTLVRRLHAVPRPDLLIQDECHHVVTTNQWGVVRNYWSTVPYIGFTATPQRTDGRGLNDTFQELILGPTIRELVQGGWLTVPVVFRPPHEVTVKYKITRGDFDTAEQQKVMTSRAIVGDVIAHYRKHLDGQPTIVACVSVEHARIMADVFCQAGYRAAAVWGAQDERETERILDGLGNGEIQVVTFDDLISEGVDIPNIAGVIMLRKTQSVIRYLQTIGRALRPAPGKTKAIILDHAGNYYIHGHPLEERDWSLEARAKKRKDEPPPITTTCPQCFGVWPGQPRSCPSCGYNFLEQAARERARDLKIIEGELVQAGAEGEDLDDLTAFIARTLRMDPKKRIKAMTAKAFELAVHGEEGKRKLKALTRAIGYQETWSTWAWNYVQKNLRN